MMPENKTEAMVERKKAFTTTVDGTVVNRVYSLADLEELKQEDIGLPGVSIYQAYNAHRL